MESLKLALSLLVLVFSVIFHECAHGLAAERCGDPTARNAGRITLNPLPHLDPLGSFIVPLITYLLAGWVVGWAKPVPINPYNFNDPKKGMFWVGLAGPLTNFLLAGFSAFLFRFVTVGGTLASFVVGWAVVINIILGIFNLLPIPPLDGSRILMGLVPERYAFKLMVLERYYFFLLFLFIFLLFPFLIFPLSVKLAELFLGVPIGI